MIRPLLAAAALLAGAGALGAQTPLPPTSPRLMEIVRLAQDGYGDSARTAVAKVLAATKPTDAGYPEVLYAAGAVARTLDETRRHYARIVVEYESSAWADKALLRLAQLDYGAGDGESAVTRITRLFRDYPRSPALPVAALFGARAAFERRQLELGCGWLDQGLAGVGDDVEVKNQLDFAKQRCTPANIAAAKAAGTPPAQTPPAQTPASRPVTQTPPPPPAAAPATGGGWRVQVAAITGEAAITRAAKKIEAAGFTAYRVAGPNGLTKLQAGPFATREEASAAVATLKTALGGTPFVTTAPVP